MRIKPLGWIVILLVILVCVGTATFVAANGLPFAIPGQGNLPFAAAATSTTAPPKPNTAVPPTVAPAPLPTNPAAPTAAGVATPGGSAARTVTLTVAFDSFGSYFTAIQVYGKPDRSYNLVLVPLGFNGQDWSEKDRAQKLVTGE